MANNNESNEKAKLTASLGLCHVERADNGRVTSGICPAKGGQMAHVKFKRYPTSIQVTSCQHHQFSGGSHRCEAFENGMVCYHAKAILIQSADEGGYDLDFDSKASDGCIPVFVGPAKMVFMKPVVRAAAVKVDACEVCRGSRGGVPGNEQKVDGKIMCDHCHSDHLAAKALFEADQKKQVEGVPEDKTPKTRKTPAKKKAKK